MPVNSLDSDSLIAVSFLAAGIAVKAKSYNMLCVHLKPK